jgi:hypothetical protein
MPVGGRGDDALRLLDTSMEILERIERGLGEIAALAKRSEPPSSGLLYSLYTLLTRLHDNLAELRGRLAADG